MYNHKVIQGSRLLMYCMRAKMMLSPFLNPSILNQTTLMEQDVPWPQQLLQTLPREPR